MMHKLTLKRPGRRWIVAAVILILLAAGLWLDLKNHGLAWQFLWNVTGEEEPLPQVRGFVEYLGNFIRPPLNLDPMTPISHTDVTPYGINTFLQQEVEPEKRERSLQMIADAGFGMIRQQFPWADIEVDGRGLYTDTRNDRDGDGQPDTIDAWAKYDNIVELAERYGIQIQARLDNPPAWSRSDPNAGDFAPPDDYQDFVNFAVAVAERYEGRIRYYQIWNEPNANTEWGNGPANPEQYTDLLCQTYTALKAVDPDIVVISAPLSPTVSLTDTNLNDFIYLQRMYDAGAGSCFDVMAAQGYGFFSGPTDRRMRPQTLTFARNLYIRDLMVANGDAHKSIWISEAAWNAQPEDPGVVTSQYGAFGIASEERAARYMPLGYQRALEEWPWIGNISYWFFKRPADYERNQAFYYFRMVEPDFTPLPVYDSMKQYITTQTPVLYPGVHQAEDWRVKLPDDAEIVDAEGAEFGKAVEALNHFSFTAYGTDVIIRWQGDGGNSPYGRVQRNEGAISFPGDTFYEYPLMTIFVIPFFDNEGERYFMSRDGAKWRTDETGWINQTIIHSNLPDKFDVEFASGVGGNPLPPPKLRIDSITVVDRTFQNVAPLAAGVLIFVGMFVYVVVSSLRARWGR
jgi:polysaccharide biosynthesis protein PslG